jgi:tetratricopeptide (TPR) repeat protein
MFHKYFFHVLACTALLLSVGIVASAQTAQLRGHVIMKNADGTTTPVADAAIDVFRTDLSAKYQTKTDKKGSFVFAGLPFVGRYAIGASKEGAQPGFVPQARVGQEIDYEIEMFPGGDGKRLTLAEINSLTNTSPAGAPEKVSAEELAKRAEAAKKLEEVTKSNERSKNINEIVNRTFKAGNDALKVKNFEEAIKQYQEGLVADPEQGVLYQNLSIALRQRGVDRYNTAVRSAADAEKTAGIDAAKQDFRQSAENAQKAVLYTQKEEVHTDATELANQNARKLDALLSRTESMRLFVTMVDQSQADAGLTAFNEYIAAEPDAVKKEASRRQLAKMLLDAGAGDKALVEYQKILEAKPDDPDAMYGAGLALYATGDKAKYQDAANYFQRFVDKAPDGHKDKEAVKAVLAELKASENVVPDKTPTPTRRRRP